jgi:hypothetical protein
VPRQLNVMGLRSLVYGACALVVLLCLLFMVLVLLSNHGAAQHDSYAPNRGVPQYYSPVLPHCPTLCLIRGGDGVRTT